MFDLLETPTSSPNFGNIFFWHYKISHDIHNMYMLKYTYITYDPNNFETKQKKKQIA